MESHLSFIRDNMDDKDRTKFSDLEYEKFKRVVDYMKSTKYSEDQISEGRRDFYNWFFEYDKRRNTSLLNTFPELNEFWELCYRYNS
jgi:hypothetical protein